MSFRLCCSAALMAVLSAAAALPGADSATTIANHAATPAATDDAPTVQVALLLDDSGSMQGLINQARAQLWDLVQQLGRLSRDGKRPRLEVALYHYGDLRALETPLIPFTSDLDRLSEVLFTINGGGGTEACGQVMAKALDQLAWRSGPQHLRLVVIAGNEPFTQGSVPWSSPVARAVGQGIVVHTIHCGPRRDGVEGQWEAAALAGRGTFTCIDHNANTTIKTPQDDELGRLNTQLNATYVGYGAAGQLGKARQVAEDGNAGKAGVLGSRASSKAGALYRNSTWDVVDAVQEKQLDLASATAAQLLPAELAAQDPAQRQATVERLAAERRQLQASIAALSQERDRWLASQSASGAASLGDGLRQALSSQAVAAGYAVQP